MTDSNSENDDTKNISSTVDDESQMPKIQINPLTIMTSVQSFKPVDENEMQFIENIPEPKSTIENNDVSLPFDPNILPTNTIEDNRSVAAWVESTTSEAVNLVLERSPSLPSTLIEPIVTRSRGNSIVSTIVDAQQSFTSDALTSQQVSFTNDVQRSLSVPPLNDSFYLDNNDMTKFGDDNDDNDDDTPEFLPVPESEESEVEKSAKPSSKDADESFNFPARSPTTRQHSPKQTHNVSFDTSVSFETLHKSPSIVRQRRSSLTTDKPRIISFHRSQSYIHAPRQSPSLHSQILRKQFQRGLSMPNGEYPCWLDPQRPLSDLSDSVFLSTPNTASSKSSPFLHSSVISDASGRSGIESTNLDTSVSDQGRIFSIDETQEQSRRTTTVTTRTSISSSMTPSTQSLSSSSDDDELINRFDKLHLGKNKHKEPIDLKRTVQQQLRWLLEKKTMLYAKSNVKQHQQQRPSTNSFVEFCSTFQSNHQADHHHHHQQRRISGHLLNSMPPFVSQHSSVDPMNQSFTSIRSTHSDSSATTSLHNSKPTTARHSFNPVLINTHQTRKRPTQRRNFSSLSISTRERRNSWTKPDQTLSLKDQDEKSSPLNRNIEAILNEHLHMFNQIFTNYSATANLHYATSNLTSRDFLYTHLCELSQRNPMKQRCSRIETKAFIDLITNFHMHRAHHYSFLTDSIREIVRINNDALHYSHSLSENDVELKRNRESLDGHIASNESSNGSSPCLTRYTSIESKSEVNVDRVSFDEQPLRFFRRLSDDYIFDCEQTEAELKKLFDLADQQHILYCLKHVDSGHENDVLAIFNRRLDALYVWYNLYYELTISVKKLSGLLRCDECDDWPKLRFRSIATFRERKAKRADEDDIYYESTDEEYEDDDDENAEINSLDDSNAENEDESEILPKVNEIFEMRVCVIEICFFRIDGQMNLQIVLKVLNRFFVKLIIELNF